jgi:hypothetical protein
VVKAMRKRYLVLALSSFVIGILYAAYVSFWSTPGASARSADNSKYGYVNKGGNFVIPPTFDTASDFRDGMASVGHYFEPYYDPYDNTSIRYGLINTKGQFIIPIRYTQTRWTEPSYGEGLIPTTMNNLQESPLGKLFKGSNGRVSLSALPQMMRCGYKNSQGQMIIPSQFEQCGPFEHGLAITTVNVTTEDPAKIAGINAIIVRNFKSVSPITKKKLQVQEFGLIDKLGHWFIQPTFLTLAPAYNLDKLYAVNVSGMPGYLSRKREIVLLPGFDKERCDAGKEDAKLTAQKKVQIGTITRTGQVQIQKSLNWLTVTRQGLMTVKLNNQTFWIAEDGQLRPISELEFSDNLARLFWGIHVGFLDSAYQWVIKPRKWSPTSDALDVRVSDFHNDRAILLMTETKPNPQNSSKNTYLFGAIDKSGKTVIAPKFRQMDQFSEGMAIASNIPQPDPFAFRENVPMPLYGYSDLDGNWAISPQYKKARRFKEGLAAVQMADKMWGFINRSGAYVFKPQFAFASDFEGGYATVVTGKPGTYRVNLIDHEGKALVQPLFDPLGQLIIHPDYERAEDEKDSRRSNENFTQPPHYERLIFKEGLARVRAVKDKTVNKIDFEGDHYFLTHYESHIGFLDSKGNLVIPPQFTEAEDFKNALAKVKGDNNLWGYIDETGHFVVPLKCKELGPFVNGLAKCKV